MPFQVKILKRIEIKKRKKKMKKMTHLVFMKTLLEEGEQMIFLVTQLEEEIKTIHTNQRKTRKRVIKQNIPHIDLKYHGNLD